MSAQALLSLIAPVAPSAPQGAATADASGFEDVLKDLLGERAEAAPVGEDGPQTPDKTAEAPAVTGFLIPPVVPPATPNLTPVTGPAPETLPADVGQASDTVAPPPPPTLPEAEAAPSVAGTGPQPEPSSNIPDPSRSLASLAASVGPTPDASAVAPPATEVAAGAPVTAEHNAASAASPGPASAANAAHLIPAAQAAAEATPLAPVAPNPASTDAPAAIAASTPVATGMTAPAPTPVSLPAAPPPPLKPLTERTAKADGGAIGTEPVTETARGAATGVTTPSVESQPPSDQPVKSVEAAAPVAHDPTAANEDGASPAPPEVSTTTTAPQTAREIGLSALSRAAIDATTQIAAQILRKLEGRSTSFEMALTPDDLGRVDVKLDIDSEGRLAARLAFDNPAAATDLRGRADELRRQLEAQGFHLAEDAFEFTQRDSGSHAFDRGQDQRGGHARFSAAARLNAETDAAPPVWTALSLSPSGVDMKV